MAESTLSISRDELRKRIAEFAGYGRTEANWSAEQIELIDGILDTGLRQFYFPAPNPVAQHGYSWKFLKPVATLVLWPSISEGTDTVTGGAFAGGSTPITASAPVFYPSMIGKTLSIDGIGDFVVDGYTSGTVISVTGDASTASADVFSMAADGTYRMPDDFGGVVGDQLPFGNNEAWLPAKLTGEAAIRELYMTSNVAGHPKFVAFRPVEAPGTSGQRWEAYAWPIPDGIYNMSYRKIILANALTVLAPYPYGGMWHADTMVESCLAAAELRLNDERGVHYQAFLERLSASIAQDRRLGPTWLGYNGDASSYEGLELSRVTNVTVDGVLYE